MKLALPFLLAINVSAADLLTEIARAESNKTHSAVGDGGRARGAWQMHRAAWDDACKRLGVSWDHKCAHDPVEARIVAANHLGWLQGQFRHATGRNPTPRDSYALWNLGFAGYQRRGFRIENAPETTRKAAMKLNTKTPWKTS